MFNQIKRFHSLSKIVSLLVMFIIAGLLLPDHEYSGLCRLTRRQWNCQCWLLERDGDRNLYLHRNTGHHRHLHPALLRQ